MRKSVTIALAVGIFALSASIPVFIGWAADADFTGLVKDNGASPRELCLQAAKEKYQADIQIRREDYAASHRQAKEDYRQAVRDAWNGREATIKANRVVITKPDRQGEKEDKRAERLVFDTAKTKAEQAYESAKKAALTVQDAAIDSAKEAKRSAYASAKQRYASAKQACEGM